MGTKEQIEGILKENNFDDFQWINPKKDVEVAQWVRVKCQFGCSDYGLGACPPNTPSVKECKQFFSEYKQGIIVKLTHSADKNNYPSDWSLTMTEALLKAERQIFLSGYEKVFLLNQSCCTLCTECTGSRKECKDKRRSRPSPESFAVDVYQTVKNVGMQIQVISDNPSEINRIAFILIR